MHSEKVYVASVHKHTRARQKHVKQSHVTLECVHFVLADFTNSTPGHVALIKSTSLEVHSNH